MYIKVKTILKILDDIMSRPDIKHKGKAIRNAIKRLPGVDAVEVCRCKDCEYYAKFNGTEGRCKYFNSLRWYEDYCSDGKKVTDDV